MSKTSPDAAWSLDWDLWTRVVVATKEVQRRVCLRTIARECRLSWRTSAKRSHTSSFTD